MKILAAEDTPSLRALLQLCLERAGHEVDLAEDGQAALDRFTSSGYELVVLDIQMPVMDGLMAAKAMRDWEKAQGLPPVPILALSANTEGADVYRCLEAGFTSTVRKPFGREDLLAAIRRSTARAEPAPAPAPAPSPEPADRIVVEADPDLAELIAPFLVSCRAEAAAMREAAGRGDLASVAAASRKIVGAGAGCGFGPLSDECRALESAAKNGDAAGVAARLDAVDSYLERVKVVYSS